MGEAVRVKSQGMGGPNLAGGALIDQPTIFTLLSAMETSAALCV